MKVLNYANQLITMKNNRISKSLPENLDRLKKELDLMHHQFDRISKVCTKSNRIYDENNVKVRNINQTKKSSITNLKTLLDIALKEYKQKLKLR